MATTPVSKTIDQLEALANPTRSTKVIVGSGNKLYANLLSSLFALVTKADVGLPNVDNTSDADKPVSTATAQALQAKASQQSLDALAQALADKASQADLDALVQAATHFVTDTALSQALQGKANAQHSHSLEDVTDLIEALNGKADASHQHPQSAIQSLVEDLNAIRLSITGKAAAQHSHAAADITGLPELILELIGELPSQGSVTSGVNQW